MWLIEMLSFDGHHIVAMMRTWLVVLLRFLHDLLAGQWRVPSIHHIYSY